MTGVMQRVKCIADAMSADSPHRFVAPLTKSKRKGKILIDYLRNGRGSTAVAPYSTRARLGAAISMPLDWSELRPRNRAGLFHGHQRTSQAAALDADPWEDFWEAVAPLAGGKG